MDLYRYFHPHYSPRLKNTPIRLLEIAELELAAIELKKALERAGIRVSNNPIGGINEEHFSELLIAANYITESLSALSNAHPGDSQDQVLEMIKEREVSPGWENWVRLLKQRLNDIEEQKKT